MRQRSPTGRLSPDEDHSVDAHLADLRTVGGEPLVRRILVRFEHHLADAVAGGTTVWTRVFAHRTAGLAGMIGFERLAAACRRIETAADAGSQSVAEGVAAAEAALEAVRRRLDLPQ